MAATLGELWTPECSPPQELCVGRAPGGVCSHLILLGGENLVEMWKTLCPRLRPTLPEEKQVPIPA